MRNSIMFFFEEQILFSQGEKPYLAIALPIGPSHTTNACVSRDTSDCCYWCVLQPLSLLALLMLVIRFTQVNRRSGVGCSGGPIDNK